MQCDLEFDIILAISQDFEMTKFGAAVFCPTLKILISSKSGLNNEENIIKNFVDVRKFNAVLFYSLFKITKWLA